MAQEKTSQAQGLFEGSTDIGAALKGSTVYDAQRGEYRIAGGGADMWGEADAFHLSWTRFSGDATLTADVHFPSGKLVPLEKAVLIFRQSLDPGSAYADVAIHGDGHITLQYRKITGGKTEDTTSAEHGSIRLRIERKGDQFTISAGPEDGKMAASAPVTVVLHDPVYVGIGMCAHDADGLAAVTFSNVRLERGHESALK
jgi:TolB protein